MLTHDAELSLCANPSENLTAPLQQQMCLASSLTGPSPVTLLRSNFLMPESRTLSNLSIQASTQLRLPGKTVSTGKRNLCKQRLSSHNTRQKLQLSLWSCLRMCVPAQLWLHGALARQAGDRDSWTSFSHIFLFSILFWESHLLTVALHPLRSSSGLLSTPCHLTWAHQTLPALLTQDPCSQSVDTLKKLGLSISVTPNSDGHPSRTLPGLWDHL